MPHYFKKNPFLIKLKEMIPANVVSEILGVIGHIYPILEINRPTFKQGDVVKMLDAYKNQVTGKLN
jgi:hypothetical protein